MPKKQYKVEWDPDTSDNSRQAVIQLEDRTVLISLGPGYDQTTTAQAVIVFDTRLETKRAFTVYLYPPRSITGLYMSVLTPAVSKTKQVQIAFDLLRKARKGGLL